MNCIQKWCLAVTMTAAVLLAMTTLRPASINVTREKTHVINAGERDLPSLMNSMLPGTGNTTPGVSTALKIYWELGYFWQEETIEREWCMRCDGGCSAGNGMRTTACNSTSLPPTQLIIIEDTIIPATIPILLVQIEVAGTGLCLEAGPEDDVVFLNPCQNFLQSQNQWFYGFNETFADRFEIRPFVEPDQCLTQLHHPKDGETIIIQFCDVSQEDNTSFWEKY